MWTTKINRAAVKGFLRANSTRLRTDYVFTLGVFVALLSITVIIQTMGTAISRMPYPFALEWMEGSTMDHVRVVLARKPMYVQPSVEWTPAIYTPLYYWTCAVFMKAFGVSLFWARFVSTCSVFGSLCLIAQFIRKETGGGIVGPLAGAALYAISFPLTGAWIDLARVDSLFFFLFLAGAYWARHGTTRVSAVAAGVLLFLSFFTKQTALLLAMPVLFASVLISWRRGLIIVGVFAGLVIGSIQWMDLSSDGWFHYYVFDVARKHSMPPREEWRKYVLMSAWEPMPVAVAVALASLVSGAIKGWRVVLFYAGTLAATAVAGFSSLAKNGGFFNAMIPYCGVVAMLGGILVGWALRYKPESPVGRRMQAAAMAVLLLQFVQLSYDQRKYIPRRRDAASGKAMIERWKLLHAHGEVYSFGFGYYDALAGGDEIHAHSMAIADILRTEDHKESSRVREELRLTIASRRYPTIIADESLKLIDPVFETTLRANYSPAGSLFLPDEGDRTWPRTGFNARPNEIWIVR